MPGSREKKSADKLQKLDEMLRGKGTLLIVLQDHPDPDAIAAAAALRQLANVRFDISCSIAHGGVVGRAENAAMTKYLGLNLRPVAQLDITPFDALALVDTQPGTGNNSLPKDAQPDIVIDHHPVRRDTRRAPFTDIRKDYGATCTILCEYLRNADVPLEPPLATAMLYGIRSDTQDLGRESTQADVDALLYLYPLANKRVLAEIQRADVPRGYYRLLARAITNARTHGKCLVTGLEEVTPPDMISEVAELLLRNEGSEWVLCYGFNEGKVLLSLRTSGFGEDAGKVMRRIVGRKGTGGGHRRAAGGQIPLRKDTQAERRHVERTIRERLFRQMGVTDVRGERLVK